MTDVKVKVELQSDGEDNEIDIETDTDVVQRNSVELLRNGPFTNFSIEEILKPDFGVKRRRSAFSQLNTPSPKASPKEQDENRSPGSGGTVGQLPLPAWVYCTRYSDRPSSGKLLLLYRYLLKYTKNQCYPLNYWRCLQLCAYVSINNN